tara:strand:+ start:1608 stop:1994 length:387 start_codon:yes stop_codon:yes gene_type:complete
MATQIVISNNDSIKIDDSFHINWADKGTVMPAIPDTVHYLIWNALAGQNEIQNKDASTGDMAGSTDLNATSDAVGSTTIAELLTWGETRKGQIETATAAYDAAVADDKANETTNALGKTWVDYDPNHS